MSAAHLPPEAAAMPKTQARNRLIQFRVRPDEAAALRAAADAAGVPLSAYARMNALDHASLEAVAARLAEIAQRIAQMSTRAEAREDLSTLGRAIAVSIKSKPITGN